MSVRPTPTTLGRPGQSRPRFVRRLGPLLAIALAASSFGVLATPATTLGWSANGFSSTSERQLFALTNQARASAGRRTLQWDSALASIARWRSKDMIVRDYFSHDIPGGGRVFDVMTSRGYCYRVAGENIGWNTYPDDVATETIQQMFMNSSGHRANILGSSWDHIGIGAYKGSDGKKMWTVLFADKCGSSPVATRPKPKLRVARQPPGTPRPTPKPTPRATPRPTAPPAPTDEPAPLETARNGDLAGVAPGAAASPTPAGVSLRAVDRPASGGLLDSIFGGLSGLFGG